MIPYYDHDGITIYHGDCREVLPQLSGIQAAITSPPYWSQRVYGSGDDIGAEVNPSEWVASLTAVSGLVGSCLTTSGTFWLNVGDSYAASGKGGGGSAGKRACWSELVTRTGFRMPPPGFKMKDLTLVAPLAADSIRRSGLYLRSTVIWEKPAAVEPMRADRPAVSHEYVFLFSRSEMYAAYPPAEAWWGHSVWQIPQEGYGGHPAVMPTELARRCVVASTRPGESVVDPFAGAGSVLVAAKRLGRKAIGVEIEEKFCEIAALRLEDERLTLFEHAGIEQLQLLA